jgi:hypothetical protein
MKSMVAFGLIGLGLLMLVLSFAWVAMFPGTSSWTKEKADRWGQVKDRMHNLAFTVNAPPGTIKMHSGPDLGQAKAEYDELTKENEQLTNDFNHVYNTPRTTATFLKWGGICLAGVGLIGWYAVNNMN